MDWLILNIAEVLLLGIAMVFYKLPSAKGISKFVTAAVSFVVSLALALLLFSGAAMEHTTKEILMIALLWGVSFTALMLLQMYALDHFEAGVLFASTSVASMVITVLIGILLFNDVVSFTQGIGILLAILVVALFVLRTKSTKLAITAWVFGALITVITVFNKIMQKFAAHSNVEAFQVWQYLFATLICGAALLFARKKETSQFTRHAAIVGSLIGVFSFFGGYLLLKALEIGPFTFVMSIHSLYIIVTAIVAAFMFKEKLSAEKMVLFGLAVIAVALMRVG